MSTSGSTPRRPPRNTSAYSLRNPQLNLLITGRTRPQWATARKLVYGDFGVVDRHLLRMDEEEARRLLSHVDRHTVDSLVANAAGWPAVLGLAASGPIGQVTIWSLKRCMNILQTNSSQRVPERHKRLFRSWRFRREFRLMLRRPCAADSATEVLAEASEAGYFADSVEEPSLHPLLRHFLLNKLDLSAADVVEQRADAHGLFHPATRVGRRLLCHTQCSKRRCSSRAHRSRTRRIAARWPNDHASEWLEAANEARTRMPLIGVLEAELAGREGDAARAERIALQAAKEGDPGLRFRALCLAGRGSALG